MGEGRAGGGTRADIELHPFVRERGRRRRRLRVPGISGTKTAGAGKGGLPSHARRTPDAFTAYVQQNPALRA